MKDAYFSELRTEIYWNTYMLQSFEREYQNWINLFFESHAENGWHIVCIQN